MNDSKAHGWPTDGSRGPIPNWNGHFNDPERDVFVGGLPSFVNDRALFDLASQHGTVVRARVIVDRVTGTSRCFGYVKCATPEDQASVIGGLHGHMVSRCTLRAESVTPRGGA
jgi:RNA recognition motif-containing protein